jgi:hypothetical protein
VKTLAQIEFEQTYPEVADLYSHIDEFQRPEQLDTRQKNKTRKQGSKVNERKIFSKYDFLVSN